MRKEGKEKRVLGLGPLGSWLLFGPLSPAYSSTMVPGTSAAGVFTTSIAQL